MGNQLVLPHGIQRLGVILVETCQGEVAVGDAGVVGISQEQPPPGGNGLLSQQVPLLTARGNGLRVVNQDLVAGKAGQQTHHPTGHLANLLFGGRRKRQDHRPAADLLVHVNPFHIRAGLVCETVKQLLQRRLRTGHLPARPGQPGFDPFHFRPQESLGKSVGSIFEAVPQCRLSQAGKGICLALVLPRKVHAGVGKRQRLFRQQPPDQEIAIRLQR